MTIDPEMLAYNTGQWLDYSHLSIPLDDWGVLQGVMLVERLRTFGGKLFELDRHLNRLQQSCDAVGLSWSKVAEHRPWDLCEQIARKRTQADANGTDFGVVVLVTPGRTRDGSSPTVIVHTSDLPWNRMANWYRFGQRLITATVRNVPTECWPVNVKTRSRLHYFIADSEATRSDPHAGALLLDVNGYATETSQANIIAVRGDRILVPPRSSVLPGISLDHALRLATELGLEISETPMSVDDLQSMDELILTGTNGSVWSARSLDSIHYAHATLGAVGMRLRDAWIKQVGIDFYSQALERGSTAN